MNWNKEFSLAVHIKPKAGKEDSTHDTSAAIAITYYRESDFIATSRSLKHKGYSETFVHTRLVSENERESEIPIEPYRIKFTVYRCWDDFINDEKIFDLPDGWLDKMEALRKRYRSLDIKSKKEQLKLF